MSTAASAHYQSRSEAFGIQPLDLLDGRPWALLPSAQLAGRVAVNSDSQLARGVGEYYDAMLVLATDFVMSAANVQLVHDDLRTQRERRQIARDAVVKHLSPPGLRTGHIDTITAQAIAPWEVPEEVLGGFTPAIRERLRTVLADPSANAVCLVTTADVQSGRTRGDTHCLTVVAAETNKNGGRSVAYFSGGFADNRQFGGAARRTSAWTAHVLRAQGVGNPVRQWNVWPLPSSRRGN